MTKMLRVCVVLLLLSTSVASASFFDAWNVKNERVFGEVEKIEEFSESGELARAEYYNEKGQKTRIELYSREGKLFQKHTMEYNKDGDLFQVRIIDHVATEEMVMTAVYKAKNVIKCVIIKAIDGKEEKTLKTEPFEYDENKRLTTIKLKNAVSYQVQISNLTIREIVLSRFIDWRRENPGKRSLINIKTVCRADSHIIMVGKSHLVPYLNISLIRQITGLKELVK